VYVATTHGNNPRLSRNLPPENMPPQIMTPEKANARRAFDLSGHLHAGSAAGQSCQWPPIAYQAPRVVYQ